MLPKLSTGTPTILFLNEEQLPCRPDGVWQFDEESRRLPVRTAQNPWHNRLSLLKTPKAKEILEFLRHSEF
jgi:hypothetical protein